MSDEELGILARIVQEEWDRYNADAPVEEYQIVKLPRVQFTDAAGDDGNNLIMFPDYRPNIARPVITLPDDEVYEANRGEQLKEIPEVRRLIFFIQLK